MSRQQHQDIPHPRPPIHPFPHPHSHTTRAPRAHTPAHGRTDGRAPTPLAGGARAGPALLLQYARRLRRRHARLPRCAGAQARATRAQARAYTCPGACAGAMLASPLPHRAGTCACTRARALTPAHTGTHSSGGQGGGYREEGEGEEQEAGRRGRRAGRRGGRGGQGGGWQERGGTVVRRRAARRRAGRRMVARRWAGRGAGDESGSSTAPSPFAFVAKYIFSAKHI